MRTRGKCLEKAGRILFCGILFFSADRGAALDTEFFFRMKETFGIGPRAMGMGGAFAAVADDPSAVYWNPAGLVQIPAFMLSASSAPVYFKERLENGREAFGRPYYASLQLIAPLSVNNVIGFSLFRPFHPQRNLFQGTDITTNNPREDSYLLNPSFQQNELIFSYGARFSLVPNFSLGVNVKRITQDRFYIRYFGNDPVLDQIFRNRNRVRGFGVDLGMLYRVPVKAYTQELRFALSLKDVVGRVEFRDGLVFETQTAGGALNADFGPGFEVDVPAEVILGVAFKNNFLFRVRNITSLDFSQIADARFDSNENKELRTGTEFWFFRDVLGVRAGYRTPFSRPGVLTAGLSIRALRGDFQTDLALLQPIREPAEVEEGTLIGRFSTAGINFEKFHIGLSYRFGSEPEWPPPQVQARVVPAAFTPANAEVAVFHLDYESRVTPKRWSVLIYDNRNRLVRALRGVGVPPVRVLWRGEADSYEPLPAGAYSWSFQVEDQLGHIGATPIQPVELLAPAQVRLERDPTRLYNIRQQQAALLASEQEQLSALAREKLQELLAPPEALTATTVAEVQTPVEAEGTTPAADAGPYPMLGFRNLAPDQVLNAHFEREPDGRRSVVISYRSNLNYVPYVYQEVSRVLKAAAASLGERDIANIVTRVYYGKNELVLRTPARSAALHAQGALGVDELLRVSDVTLNGEKISPYAI